ncbi:MAG TPA: hypothetical protein LFV92_00695 [Rickettsia endosymbiont of Ceroptres masudai]|nr:hypothetical protein [Rickettsia endosymbiont of Ceroptres masudai]
MLSNTSYRGFYFLSLRATKDIVAWLGFPSLREELHSNSTKQSSKKF